ncbi:MAG: Uma2 family endonuclease [Candidatus Competibacteraceae bacterium]|nr:Uma2 family endonuclease [Candidatus Competibacteraceae bacterium]MCP5126143.1 Uma2 family endonuclease [Gammaproteobacteria bacterium]HRX71207.1 Uma2 family endonuclease [Candidatus Competibacteraceae bacterium]
MSPSYYHAYICSKLRVAFNTLEEYMVYSELTLQIQGKDYVPDIALYPKRPIDFTAEDIVKMTEMPVLIVEVLSPTQAAQEILGKFHSYFDAGIQSCWLVIPISTSVIVYSAMNKAQVCKIGDIVDPVLDIRIALDAIFGQCA